MSSFHQYVVATEVAERDAEKLEARARKWLVVRDIIEPSPMSFDEARNIRWYADRAGADARVHADRDPATYRAAGHCLGNGLGLGVGYQYAHPFQGDMSLRCPRCAWENDLDLAWDVISALDDRRAPGPLVCVACEHRGELDAWNACPPFATGHFAVHLDDWPRITMGFFRELRAALRVPLKYVGYRL